MVSLAISAWTACHTDADLAAWTQMVLDRLDASVVAFSQWDGVLKYHLSKLLNPPVHPAPSMASRVKFQTRVRIFRFRCQSLLSEAAELRREMGPSRTSSKGESVAPPPQQNTSLVNRLQKMHEKGRKLNDVFNSLVHEMAQSFGIEIEPPVPEETSR